MYPGRGGVGREGGVWEVWEVWGDRKVWADGAVGSGQMGERGIVNYPKTEFY
ncbi:MULTISPECIES: hypothetical protein [Moorena]|uniref:hypothetical protein n=1 Tax=Moorena TaxID=1155738 RepID=UPI001438E0A9|nr:MULTISPECIES: hypothetical protein [Moorena]